MHKFHANKACIHRRTWIAYKDACKDAYEDARASMSSTWHAGSSMRLALPHRGWCQWSRLATSSSLTSNPACSVQCVPRAASLTTLCASCHRSAPSCHQLPTHQLNPCGIPMRNKPAFCPCKPVLVGLCHRVESCNWKTRTWCVYVLYLCMLPAAPSIVVYSSESIRY